MWLSARVEYDGFLQQIADTNVVEYASLCLVRRLIELNFSSEWSRLRDMIKYRINKVRRTRSDGTR